MKHPDHYVILVNLLDPYVGLVKFLNQNASLLTPSEHNMDPVWKSSPTQPTYVSD